MNVTGSPFEQPPTPQSRLARWVTGRMGIGCAGILVIGVWLGVEVVRSREAAYATLCRGRIGHLAMALHVYHDEFGCLPPPFVPGPDGTPWHSWRVLVLPYLDQGAAYDRYRFDEPWNSEHNQTIAALVNPAIFQCRSLGYEPGDCRTDYFVVVGERTCFSPGLSVSLDAIDDGVENTILLVEAYRPDRHWMQPTDLSWDDWESAGASQVRDIGLGDLHEHGSSVVFADGIFAYWIDPRLSIDTFRSLLTPQGAEGVQRDTLRAGPKWPDRNRLVDDGSGE